MIATDADKKLLDEVVQRIVAVAEPAQILLFGSSARGDAGKHSDADLLVVKDDVQHRGKLEEQIYVSLIGVPMPVDVIVLTREDVERHRNRVGSIVMPALREGRVLYDANA